MSSKRDLTRRLEEAETETGEDPTQAGLWRRYIEGEYDPEDPHPQIEQWLGVTR